MDINLLSKYVVMFVILTGFGILYEKYKLHNEFVDNHHNMDLIQKYLLKKKSSNKFPDSLFNITKPIIWIHINYEVNSREWENFYSRNIPLCGVLGGGYNKSFEKLIELHSMLHKNCANYFS